MKYHQKCKKNVESGSDSLNDLLMNGVTVNSILN